MSQPSISGMSLDQSQKRPFGSLTAQEMYDRTRPLTTKELIACIEEDSDIENADEVEVTYISPNVDEITDDEDLDDNSFKKIILSRSCWNI
ncbi:unnamed protein product [Diabrotica balteata]|uniref:Uncharacterized protein n=1 Tax=Diabrotica balteata TaxID=107213 RepID=A0A9N9T896_DIABA|nr:unnamed protein product [Diabrotica balteata]